MLLPALGAGGEEHVTVVVAVEHPGDLLGRLVALARDDHGVVRTSQTKGVADGLRAAGRLVHVGQVGAHVAHALEDGGPDGRGVLRARVLVGDHEHVGQARADLPHDRALAAVAVAVGAVDQHEPARRDRAHRLERERERVGRVGVVDEAQRPAVAALDDALHAPRDRVRAPDRVDRGVQRHARGVREHDGQGGVRDVDQARQRAVRLVHAAVGPAQREPRAHAVEAHVGVDHDPVGTRAHRAARARRDALDRDRRLLGEALTPHVVDDHDAATRLLGREQPRLGAEVPLHVAVEVEVVALQVREADDVEPRAEHAPQGERVRRDLGRQRRRTPLEREREQRLEHGRLDGRARALDRVVADPQLDGAEHGRALVHGPQRRVDEVRRGGLAVRAGDADGHEALARVAQRPRGHGAGQQAGVVGEEHRRAGGHERGALVVGEHGHGPARDRVGREPCAVDLQARHRDEEVARRHVAARHGHTREGGPGGVGAGGPQRERRDEVVDPAGRRVLRAQPAQGGRHGEESTPVGHSHVAGYSVGAAPEGAIPSCCSA